MLNRAVFLPGAQSSSPSCASSTNRSSPEMTNFKRNTSPSMDQTDGRLKNSQSDKERLRPPESKRVSFSAGENAGEPQGSFSSTMPLTATNGQSGWAGRASLRDSNGTGSEPQDEAGASELRVHSRRLSKLSWTFLVSAVIEGLVIILFQASILGVGDFSPIAEGGLGEDRKFYAILFMSAMVYMMGLGWWALHSENIVEVYAFDVLQLLSAGYAFAQVYQFTVARDSDRNATIIAVDTEDYNVAIRLASVNAAVNSLMAFFFIALSVYLYLEFGWKIYRVVKFNIKLRSVYQHYQIFSCFLKLELIFTEMFLLFHVTLLLSDDTSDPEFVGSIVGMLLSFVVVAIIFYAARKEVAWLFVVFMLILLAMLGYYSFKAYRFISKSCRLCEEQNVLLMENKESIEFAQLTMFAFIAILTTILLLLVTIKYFRLFGSGLKAHFDRAAEERRQRGNHKVW